MRYADFEYHAMEYFGLTGDEVAVLLDGIEAAGGTIRGVDEDDRSFWADLSQSDALDDALGIEPEEYEEMYDLDPYFPDDDYLDAGVEWEMTAESIEGYGETV